MKKNAVKLRTTLFLFAGALILFVIASGYLYRQNRNYQYQNQRLIILNDSILSENIELKNALQQKKPTVFKAVPGNFKKKENK
jgi:hypothetical protein